MEHIARTPEQLGQAIKAVRNAQGITQETAASKVGMKQETLSSLELRSASSTVGTLYKALSALGLELVLREKSPVDPATTEW